MRSAIVLALLITSSAAADELRVHHPFQSTVPRGAVRRVVVEIPAGDIRIRNGAADQLSLEGEASRDPDRDKSVAKQQRIVNDISVEIYISNEEAIIRRRFGPEARGFSGEKFTNYRIELTLPPDVDLDVQTRAGDVNIDGAFGNIDVNLRAGALRIRTPRDGVRELIASCRVGDVRTNLGDETLERTGLFPRGVHYKNPSGRSVIDVHVTAGEIDVDLTR